MVKTVFSFRPVTKEYVGTVQADESPLEPGEYLIPAFATTKEPPSTADREVAVFDDVAGDWMIYPDFRSVPLYSTVDGSAVTVTEIGAQPDNTTEQVRPSIYHDWDGAAWELNLNKAQAAIWESIKAERDRRQLEGGVQVDGHWFLSTDRATGEYNSLINASQGMSSDTILRSGWRTMDGAQVDMTPALASQILIAGIAQRCAIDDAAIAHKVAMEAVADPVGYDYSGGWPSVFEVV